MNLINLKILLKKVVNRVVCKNCGHALGSKNAICPNCGMMMSADQLKIRKEINGANNPYMNRLYELNKKNEKYKMEETTNTNNAVYATFIVLCVLVIAIIIAAILLRR